MPQSRPMPSIGPQCHELRITDAQATWRVIYRTDRDAIVIAGLFKKKAQQTPKNEMNAARKRLRRYDDA